MLLTILIVFFSLISLIILHEFGHFIFAKKFGVDVEEFGIGYPPRLIGKKIGGTIYSLNLLPFGAFVKIRGEEGGIEDQRSFVTKTKWQRALIIFGGVISFWVISWILLSLMMGLGTPVAISDEENQNLVNPRVQIIAIAKDSPAGQAGLKVGDVIIEIQNLKVDKVKEVQDTINSHRGESITLMIERNKNILNINLIPRISPPENEGPLGIALARITFKSYPWYQAPIKGLAAVKDFTVEFLQEFYQIIKTIFLAKTVPTGVEFVGPVGIFQFSLQVASLGINYFLRFLAMISINMAIVNILPIPALDGGKFIFLGIEAVRGKPVSQEVEKNVTGFFFALLILLMIWVTIKDIVKLF